MDHWTDVATSNRTNMEIQTPKCKNTEDLRVFDSPHTGGLAEPLSGNIFQMDENRRVDTWNTIRRVAQELAEIGDEVNESYNIDSKVRGALDDALHVYGPNLSLEIQAEDSFSLSYRHVMIPTLLRVFYRLFVTLLTPRGFVLSQGTSNVPLLKNLLRSFSALLNTVASTVDCSRNNGNIVTLIQHGNSAVPVTEVLMTRRVLHVNRIRKNSKMAVKIEIYGSVTKGIHKGVIGWLILEYHMSSLPFRFDWSSPTFRTHVLASPHTHTHRKKLE
ncbi:hypothetical protein CLF_104527 [Clonorchis sinensis]|uniref:Uncharacterized protein n=1 Tax=Clonorchis sinensis TaxID=79923 RepID=G7YBU2_CLOSI|nr:hypothetical protein CLF_104527 [Clonorchis sinensis]